MSRQLHLEGDIRQAIENFLGSYVDSKTWDTVIQVMAAAIDSGTFSLEDAGKLSHALTQISTSGPDECPTCGEPRR